MPNQQKQHFDLHTNHYYGNFNRWRGCGYFIVYCGVISISGFFLFTIKKIGVSSSDRENNNNLNCDNDVANNSQSESIELQGGFISDFKKLSLLPINTSQSTPWPWKKYREGSLKGHTITPFLLSDGKLLCRPPMNDMLETYDHIVGDFRRIKHFIDMVNVGLNLTNKRLQQIEPLPILLMNGDMCGCQTSQQRNELNDQLIYPRISWSIPAQKLGKCAAIGIPTYQSWLDYKDVLHSGNKRFTEKYPWPKKINKAVWRGSTTGGRMGMPLNETPRGELVQQSMKHPQLIDAAFVKFNQRYKGMEDELRNKTILTDRMPFNDQMNYKAIIDIDGNSWSSRFPKLLCLNSVVIKIDPEYIEYFYEDLTPMKHYIPASLDNVTNVTAYVTDERNDDEMMRIVASANAWCEDKMNRHALARDMMQQLQKYRISLDQYSTKTYNVSLSVTMDSIRKDVGLDFVECRI